MDMGQRIKQARLDKNLTQQELAELVHAKQHSVSGWESGRHRPDITTIEYLCGVLGVSVDYLLGKTEKKTGRKDRDVGGVTKVISKAYPDVTAEEYALIKKIRTIHSCSAPLMEVVLSTIDTSYREAIRVEKKTRKTAS